MVSPCSPYESHLTSYPPDPNLELLSRDVADLQETGTLKTPKPGGSASYTPMHTRTPRRSPLQRSQLGWVYASEV